MPINLKFVRVFQCIELFALHVLLNIEKYFQYAFRIFTQANMETYAKIQFNCPRIPGSRTIYSATCRIFKTSNTIRIFRSFLMGKRMLSSNMHSRSIPIITKCAHDRVAMMAKARGLGGRHCRETYFTHNQKLK